MLTKDEILKHLSESSEYLLAEYGVQKIGLFGSFAIGRAGEHSDIDLVIDFDRPIGLKFIELIDYLERLLGRRVDVLTPAGINGIRRSSVAKSIVESIVYV